MQRIKGKGGDLPVIHVLKSEVFFSLPSQNDFMIFLPTFSVVVYAPPLPLKKKKKKKLLCYFLQFIYSVKRFRQSL